MTSADARIRPAQAVSVLLADDDPLVRRVLRHTLERESFTIVAEAGTGREALEAVRQGAAPDMILLDLVMPDGSGLDVIRSLREAGDDVPVVVLTASYDDDAAIGALCAGAIGFLSKDVDLADLPRTLHAVARGEAAISRRLGRALIHRLRASPEGRIGTRPVRSPLTPREWEVLDLLCAKTETDQIAARLVLSIETVRSHIKSILRKLNVSSRAEAIALAPQLRLPNGT
jgi:NarL family two-component system response regulator LiaR